MVLQYCGKREGRVPFPSFVVLVHRPPQSSSFTPSRRSLCNMMPTLFHRRQHVQVGEDIVMDYSLLSFTAFHDVVGVGSGSASAVMVHGDTSLEREMLIGDPYLYLSVWRRYSENQDLSSVWRQGNVTPPPTFHRALRSFPLPPTSTRVSALELPRGNHHISTTRSNTPSNQHCITFINSLINFDPDRHHYPSSPLP